VPPVAARRNPERARSELGELLRAGGQPTAGNPSCGAGCSRKTRAAGGVTCRLRGRGVPGSRLLALTVERGRASCCGSPSEVLVDWQRPGRSLPLAGVPFRLGWEAREEKWNETQCPRCAARLEAEPFFQRQRLQSPTWVVNGPAGERAACPDGLAAGRRPFGAGQQPFGLGDPSLRALPGGQVMLNWPLHGNDWHGDLGGALAAIPSLKATSTASMRAHSLAFARLALHDEGQPRLDAAGLGVP